MKYLESFLYLLKYISKAERKQYEGKKNKKCISEKNLFSCSGRDQINGLACALLLRGPTALTSFIYDAGMDFLRRVLV